MTTDINPLAMMAAAPQTNVKTTSGSWFEAMAQAWGESLDRQANLIQQKSDTLNTGSDLPSSITELSTESLKLGFLSNSSHTAISSTGDALKTMAQKT
jgi:hypothetical protein